MREVKVEQSELKVRCETRDFEYNLDTFHKIKDTLEDLVENDMPRFAVAHFNDIALPDNFLQEYVPPDAVQKQLDVLHARTTKANSNCDEFGRRLVQ